MEACFLQPIDVIKTRLQLDHTGQYKGAATWIATTLSSCSAIAVGSQYNAAAYHGLPFLAAILDQVRIAKRPKHGPNSRHYSPVIL